MITYPIFTIDAEAVAIGGSKAASVLERIGKTDLATLTTDEWGEFCGTLVLGAVDAAVIGLVTRMEREP
jgi:hypothetical protein